jgi:hypothetical protein
VKGTGFATTGIVINGFITLIAFLSGEYPEWLALTMFAFVAMSITGLVMIGSGNAKTGARLVIAGSLFFVPIGLIGAIGGFKVLDQAKKDEFHAKWERQ